MAMPAADSIRPLRRAEYDRLVEWGAFEDERIELLEGALVAMSPIGTTHASAVQKLTAILVPALVGRAVVRVQSPFAALDDSEPEPDVAIVPESGYEDAHPERAYLIIEVAESPLETDRDIKQRIYARAGVEEYWIVSTADRSIEVYRSPEGDRYAVRHDVPHGERISPLRFPDLEVLVAQILR